MTLLTIYDGIPRPPHSLAEPWMAGVFVISLAFLGWIRSNYPGRFERLFKSAFNVRILRQVMREELVFSHRASILLSVLFLLHAGLALYLADVYFGWEVLYGEGLGLYAAYCLLVMLAFLLKSLVLLTIRIWADADYGIGEYLYNIYLYLKMGAVLLIPVTLVAAYGSTAMTPYFLMAVVGISVLLVLKRTARGMAAATESGLSVPYILLYVCAFEIMPFAVFIALVMRR